MLKHLHILVFLLLTCTISLAQTEEVQIEVYGFEDGLSHRNVFKIQQDNKGFIWLATFNGLNRFDGIQFEKVDYYPAEKNNSNHYIEDLCVDSTGQLYVLDNRGVYQFAADNFKSTAIYKTEEDQNFEPKRLFLDRQQQVWFSSFSAELGSSLLHSPYDSLNTLPLLGNYPDKPMVEDDRFIYTVIKDRTIQSLTKSGKPVSKFRIPSTARISNLWVDQNNQLWVLTERGEVFYREYNKFIRHELSDQITSNKYLMSAFWMEPNGDIWVGGFSSLWHYSATRKKATNYNGRIRQITKNAVNYRTIYQDRQGVLWVATDFGAVKLVKSNRLFQQYLNEGSEFCDHGICSMRGITGDGEGHIFFSYYNSIHQLDTKTDIITPLFRSVPFNNPPFGIFYHKNHLYTGNGLKINVKTLQIDTLFQVPTNDKGTMTMDKDSLMWFAYEQSIYVYDQQDSLVNLSFLPELQEAITSDITYLYQGRESDYFWVATNANGLFQISTSKGVFTSINTQNSDLSSDRILAVYEDNKANLWIATANGLDQLHIPTGRIEVLTTEEGLSNNFINGLLPEGDTCIWTSTDNGLSRYCIADQSFTNYYQQDGLSSNEFNRISFYKDYNDRLYFGGLNGVNAFYPSQQFMKQKEATEAPILWTSFARFDGNVDRLLTQKTQLSPDTTIELTHQDKFFTIEFTLANYANPSQNNYSYMLEGFEPTWSKPSNNHVARYYNIPAGDYIFKVKAAAVGENWQEEQLQIPIKVHEAFFNTWWFLLTALFLATSLVIGLFKLRIYRVEQGRRKLEKEVEVRTQELQQAKQKSDELLLNILPAETAEELKKYGKTKAKRFESVTVLFSDFKGFTNIAEQLSPEDLVAEIDLCFRTFDEIMDMYGLEKIKTIGDAYMCVGGIPVSEKNMAVKMVQAALEIQAYMAALQLEKTELNQPCFEARIGIHTGSVVAGIVGIKKFAYDIWGDTVNIAARMEASSEIGKVNISEATYQLVKDHFICTPRGKIEVKSKGLVDMYFVEGLKRQG